MRKNFSFSLKENYSVKIFSTLLFSLSASIAYSQLDSVRVLEPIVITATRTEKDPAETGRSIGVISGEEIERSVYTNVAELLSNEEGIYIVGTGQNPGNTQGIFTRGSNSNQTLIMIDGVRITDPSGVNNGLDLSELSLANVERIEIVRGSHSTIYGTSAIGGVINIITKKNKDTGLKGFSEIKAGTFGKSTSLLQENIFLSYGHKNGFYVNGNIINLNVKGIDATIDTVQDPTAFKNRDMDDFDKLDITGKVGFRNSKFDIFGSYKLTDQKLDIDNGAYNDDDNAILKFKRNLFNYGASYSLNKNIKIQFNGGFSNINRLVLNDSSIADFAGNYDHTYSQDKYRGQTYTNELQANFNFKGIDAVIGGGHYNDAMTFQTYYYSNGFWGPYEAESDLDSLDLKSSIKHAFFHSDLNGKMIDEKFSFFSLGIGARFSNHNIFGNYVTYEAAPSLLINKNSLLYFSYSTGFNAPSLYQLYSPAKFSFNAYTDLGNDKLKPETSNTFELGIKQKIADNTFITIAYFETVVHNTIEYVYLWNKDSTIQDLSFMDDRGDTYLNLGTQTNKGIEINIESKISNKLKISANASIINGSLKYTPSDIDTSQTGGHHVQLFSNGAFINTEIETVGLVRRPSSMVNLGLIYSPTNKLNIGMNSRIISARTDVFYDDQLGPYGALGVTPVSEYALVDIFSNYIITKKLSAGFRIENLFDKKYTEIKGYNTRGRSAYLKIRYSF